MGNGRPCVHQEWRCYDAKTVKRFLGIYLRGTMRMSEYELKKLLETSSTAASTLSAVSSSALSTGHIEIAAASNKVLNVFNIYIQSAPTAPDISSRLSSALASSVSDLERQTRDEGIPLTQSFKCYEDYQNCMRKAKTPDEEWVCKAVFAHCLGVDVLDQVKQLGFYTD